MVRMFGRWAYLHSKADGRTPPVRTAFIGSIAQLNIEWVDLDSYFLREPNVVSGSAEYSSVLYSLVPEASHKKGTIAPVVLAGHNLPGTRVLHLAHPPPTCKSSASRAKGRE